MILIKQSLFIKFTFLVIQWMHNIKGAYFKISAAVYTVRLKTKLSIFQNKTTKKSQQKLNSFVLL